METQQNLGMKDIDELPLSNFVDIEKVKILKQKYPKYFKQYFAGSVLPEVTVTKTVDRFHCCITIMAVVFFLSLAAVIVTRILLIN